MSVTPPTHIRLTPAEKARLLVIAERTGALGYAGGVRAAILHAERALGIVNEKPAAKKKGAVKE